VAQLAPFGPRDSEDDSWARVREAQLMVTKALPKVGVAVTTDVGDEADVHPANKEPVGVRLALAAQAIAYGRKLPYSGPIYRSMKTDGDRIVLRFKHVGKGLEARDGELTGFKIAGADGKFKPAKAVIQRDTVVLCSAEVPRPVAARYGWANFPVCNLWNKDGLPAAPFRTNAP